MIDFDNYINGYWKKNNSIPKDKDVYNEYVILEEKILNDLKQICEKDGTIVGDFYRSGLKDSSRVLEELQTWFNYIDTHTVVESICFLRPLGVNVFFDVHVSPDSKNNKYHIMHIVHYILSMGNKAYYLEDQYKIYLYQYRFFIEKMFMLAGLDISVVDSLIQLEQSIAYHSLDIEELRNVVVRYNKTELSKLMNDDAWKLYTGKGEQIIDYPPFYRWISEQISDKINEPIIKSYAKLKILIKYAPIINQEFCNWHFYFFNTTMAGISTPKDKYRKSIIATNSCLGPLIGKIYCDKYYHESNVLKIFENIVSELKSAIFNNSWMSNNCKIKSLNKLKNIKIKIGHPKKEFWKDYSDCPNVAKNNFFKNMVEFNKYLDDKDMFKCGKEIVAEEWQINSHIVNAFFDPVLNEVVLPAGILRPPFVSYGTCTTSIISNYGIIGFIIGHELTHAFDDQGSQYNEHGILQQWWDSQTIKNYKMLQNDIVGQYQKLGMNGRLTLGENIADNGGLLLAYRALATELKTIQWNPKLFFIAFAAIWRSLINETSYTRHKLSDVHASSTARINGTVYSCSLFFEAFNLKKPSKIINIWN